MFAGWNTNAWPSADHPRSGVIHAEDCYSATVERAWIALGSTNTIGTNLFYRSQRDNLVAIKSDIEGIIPQYVDLSFTNSSGILTNVQNYTVTGLCVHAGIPTNYFEYTPYRCLNGSGPFTNDATVGHPHGWTNATTEAGGTNFPGSRTNWYSTDYGWQGLYNTINNLIWTKADPDKGSLEWRESDNSFYSGSDAPSAQSSLWNGRSTRTNDYDCGSGVDISYAASVDWWDFGDASFNGQREQGIDVTACSVPTQFYSSVDVYVNCEAWAWDFDCGGACSTIPALFVDIDSTGFSEGWNLYDTWGEANTTNRGGASEWTPIGPTITDGNNPWTTMSVSNPLSSNDYYNADLCGDCSDDYEGLHYGIRALNTWVFKWNGTNGFDYKE